ncbi:MAG: type II secretion system protein GspN, partial [Deltaproteobacteria bacterium]|nr:type II secretion system protein GspN [Deltaproteobacteria bacterium]
FWGLGCFLFFFYLFFPYRALGGRILHTLEEQTSLVTRPSETERDLFGIRWARVEVTHPPKGTFPPFEIRDWTIRFHPLSLFAGRLCFTSQGTVMGGTFRVKLLVERRGLQGHLEWKGIRVDGLSLPRTGGASLSCTTGGTVSWQKNALGVSGDSRFGLVKTRIENLTVFGGSVPALDLGSIQGKVSLSEGKLDVKEVTVKGKDLKGRLTGEILLQNPLPRSRLACRLEIGLSEGLADRFPAIRAIYRGLAGRSGILALKIGGTLEVPRVLQVKSALPGSLFGRILAHAFAGWICAGRASSCEGVAARKEVG